MHSPLESTPGISPDCFCREREEREMAEREGRQIPEEDCDEENIQSPFQPISNVISVVCVLLLHSEWKLTFHWSLIWKIITGSFSIFSMTTKKRWIWWRTQPINFHTNRGEAEIRVMSSQIHILNPISISKQSDFALCWKHFIIFRQQDELELADCESKHGPEDHNDENMQSPFQPISTETSVVSI